MTLTVDTLLTNVAKHWSYWQPDVPYQTVFAARTDGQPERRRLGQERKTIALANFDPSAQPFSLDSVDQDLALMERLKHELTGLSARFATDKQQKLLIVIQGTDASAPGEVIHDLLEPAAASNVCVSHWRAPTAAERERDYLWRFHQQTPAAGEIAVFDRGHYAELLSPIVNRWVEPVEYHQRIGHINDFERMLSHTGTVILKFMLHVGPVEHQKRLQERWSNPEQSASLTTSDFDTANQWESYQRAYETMLSATHTPWAPWTVVPSNSPQHRNLMMAAVLHQVMRNLEA